MKWKFGLNLKGHIHIVIKIIEIFYKQTDNLRLYSDINLSYEFIKLC